MADNIDLEGIRQQVRRRVSSKRFEHTLGVVDTAISLASRYGVDLKKAELAAVLHDAMRGQNDRALLALARETGVDVDAYMAQYPGLLHGPLAAKWAQHELGINDEEVLCAIRAHTTGDEVMAPLTCILYLADAMEPGRNYDGVECLRESAKRNLYQATRLAIKQSEEHLLAKGRTPHPATALAVKALKKIMKEAD